METFQQALFIFLGIVVVGRARRDEQQRVKRGGALGLTLNDAGGVRIIAEFILVELGVLLVLDLFLVTLPDGHHAVERLVLGVRFVLRRLVMPLLILVRALDGAALFPQHLDGVADIIGVFFDDAR